jgi:hypothetical protein
LLNGFKLGENSAVQLNIMRKRPTENIEESHIDNLGTLNFLVDLEVLEANESPSRK